MDRRAARPVVARCWLWQRRFTEEIVARAVPSAVTGVDPSPGQIAHAKTRACAALAQFDIGDAQQLPSGTPCLMRA
ncbi:MAG: class I SAM-dependent methyltransferase [Rhizobiales bacterium]|nr:class I SAM-dependent methyltransferase [Hyphomicrobiales bacterium]